MRTTVVDATAVTVTAQVAVFAPSAVVTVIVADPSATPVTTPEELTVAATVLFEVQLTDLFVAFEGEMVATSVVVEPAGTETLVGETATPVTATVVVLIFTVIAHVAFLLPSAVVTVIVAEPFDKPVTKPVELTVATVVFDEAHVTFLLVALEGAIVAVN